MDQRHTVDMHWGPGWPRRLAQPEIVEVHFGFRSSRTLRHALRTHAASGIFAALAARFHAFTSDAGRRSAMRPSFMVCRLYAACTPESSKPSPWPPLSVRAWHSEHRGCVGRDDLSLAHRDRERIEGGDERVNLVIMR